MITNPTITITDLVGQLDKTLVAYDEADNRAVAASRAKDEPAHAAYAAEMRRLGRAERDLWREICSRSASNRDEAILQAIVATYLTVLVADGTLKRKNARRAHEALLSAISVLIEPAEPAIGETVRIRYFDTSVRNAK